MQTSAKKKKAPRSRKQKAASKENIKKAQAARRLMGPTTGTDYPSKSKPKRSAAQTAASKENIKKAQEANRKKSAGAELIDDIVSGVGDIGKVIGEIGSLL